MGFNRHTGSGVVTEQDIVTCPADTVITIIGVTVANVTGELTTVTVKVAGVNILKDVLIDEGSAIVPVGGEQKIVLVAGDTLSVSADYDVDVIVSTLEQGV